MNAHLFIRRCTFAAAFMMSAAFAGAQVDTALKSLGMENIRTVETEDGCIAAFEDRAYRSSYYGVGKAIETALGARKAGSLTLVVTDRNGMPQLRIFIDGNTVEDFACGKATIRDVYTRMEMGTCADRELELLKGTETKAKSAWRPDLTVYPNLFLENTSFDKLYRYAVALAPAIEMPLWKGAEITAQVIFPVVTNQKGELKTIRPGFVTFRQGVYLKKNWHAWVTGGLFNNNRMGGNVEAMWRSPKGRWELGGRLGATVWSLFDEDGWTITNKPKLDAAVYGRVYIPGWNTELYGSVNRFVYGDYGAMGEVTRHFGEYTVGLYAMVAGGDINGGFSFAIPLPGKKYNRWKGMRLKPSDYFAFRYSMVAWGDYVDKNLGVYYNDEPNKNRSKGFYQPEYVRYFLIKELDRKN